MGIRSLLQFRLRTFLIVVTALPLLVWAILAFLRPHITDITLEDWSVVIHFSPETSAKLAPNPFQHGGSLRNSPADPYHVHMYTTIPLISIFMLGVVVSAILAIAFFIVRLAVRWLRTSK